MTIEQIKPNYALKHSIANFPAYRKEISYGYINLHKSEEVMRSAKDITPKDKIMAGLGAAIGVTIPLVTFMKKQKAKNIFQVKYNALKMITIAACGNLGGILLSSIGEQKNDQIKKWKEGAFQMSLTSLPLLLVDGSVKLCEKASSTKINNNIVKILVSAIGVAIGSNVAIGIYNKIRSGKEAKRPERELKPIDMIANIDDIVAIMVLAKIPFAKKIKIERALPFIYTFCGYRSGTGDRKNK